MDSKCLIENLPDSVDENLLNRICENEGGQYHGCDSDRESEFPSDDTELLDFVEMILNDNLEALEEECSKSQSSNQKPEEQGWSKELKSALNDRAQKTRRHFELSGLITQKMKVYNALTDVHLNAFLAKRNRKEILMRNGLLDEDGFIVVRPTEYLRLKSGGSQIQSKTGEKSQYVSTIQVKEKQVKSPYEATSWALKDTLVRLMFQRRRNEEKRREALKKENKPTTKNNSQQGKANRPKSAKKVCVKAKQPATEKDPFEDDFHDDVEIDGLGRTVGK